MHIEVVLFFSECRPLATPIEVSRRCEYSAPLKNQATFTCLTSYSSVLECHPGLARTECSVGALYLMLQEVVFCLGGAGLAWRNRERVWRTFQAVAATLSLLKDSERCKTACVVFELYFGVVAFLLRGFARDTGLNCVDIAVPAFLVVFLAEYCTSFKKLVLICGFQNNSYLLMICESGLGFFVPYKCCCFP